MNIKEFTYRIFPVKNKLFRFAMRLVKNSAEAEDIVQEVLIKTWNKRTDLGHIQNIEAWCMRLTRNMSIDKMRSKHQRTEQLGDSFDLATPQATPYQRLASNDTIQHIQALMQLLPEKQQLVMQLRDIEEMSYQEIADTLEISLDQVRVNLFRARQAIKKHLIQSAIYER